MAEVSPDEYEAPVLLSQDEVVFPHSEVAITARDPRNSHALLQAVKEHQLIVFMPGGSPKDFAGSIGTLALIRKTHQTGGSVNASLKGLWRIRVEKVLEESNYARVRFTKAEEAYESSAAKPGSMTAVLSQIDEFVRLIPGIPPEIIVTLRSAESPGKLADLCANSPGISSEERLDLLNTLGAEERLRKVNKLFERHLAALRELAKIKTITDCDTCMELADRAFESESNRGQIAMEFLNHVIQEHTGELLGLLAERYGPTFLRRRALK